MFRFSPLLICLALVSCGTSSSDRSSYSDNGYERRSYRKPSTFGQDSTYEARPFRLGKTGSSSGSSNRMTRLDSAYQNDYSNLGGNNYSSTALRSPSRTFHSSDYRTERTLGGNTRVSDRYGNSSVFEKNMNGGGYRSTSNTGRTTQYSQNLSGNWEAKTDRGTTYRAEKNLGGGYNITGSDGTRYQRTQTLGGGYRYDPY